MAALGISGAAWANIPRTKSASLGIYGTSDEDASPVTLEVSLDGGATWLDEDSAPAAIPTIGGLLDIGAYELGIDGEPVEVEDGTPAIWVIAPNAEGHTEILVRARQGSEVSDPVPGRITCVSWESTGAGTAIQMPDGYHPTLFGPGPAGGFVTCAIYPAGSTGTVDFGSGVTQAILGNCAVIAVFDADGAAVRSVALQVTGSAVMNVSAARFSSNGAVCILGGYEQPSLSSTHLSQLRRNGEGSSTTVAGKGATHWCIDLTDLSVVWLARSEGYAYTGVALDVVVGESVAYTTGTSNGGWKIWDGSAFTETTPGLTPSGSAQNTGGCTFQVDLSTGDAEAVLWVTHTGNDTDRAYPLVPLTGAVRGNTAAFCQPGARLWRKTVAGGPLQYPTWNGTSAVYNATISTSSSSRRIGDAVVVATDDGIHANFLCRPDTYNSTSANRAATIIPVAGALTSGLAFEGTALVSSAGADTSTAKFGVATITLPDTGSGSRVAYVRLTTVGGGEIATASVVAGAQLPASQRTGAQVATGALVSARAPSQTVLDEYASGVTLPDGGRASAITLIEDGDFPASSIVYVEGVSPQADIIGLAPGGTGATAWVLLQAVSTSGPPTPLGLQPPVTSIAAVGSQTRIHWVLATTATPEWSADVGVIGYPADPAAPVPPTDPATEDLGAPVEEGALWTATFTSTDPNESIVDHPDPVVDLEIRVWDSATATWRTSADAVAVPSFDGTLSVENFGGGSVSVTISPHSEFDAAVTVRLQAVATCASGAQLFSSVVSYVIDWLAEPDAPSDPEGEFADTMEDTPVSTWFDSSDPDTGDSHTWYVSPNTDPEAAYSPASSSAVTLYDDSDTEKVAGTAQWTAGQGDLHARLTFTPAANYHGTTSGSVQVRDSIFESGWSSFSITVHPVIDDPGPITPTTFPDIIEDDFAIVRFSVTDPDLGDSGVTWEWEVSADGAYWTDDWADGVDLKVTIVDTEEASEETDDLWVDVKIEPRGNYNGPATFALRMTKTSPTDTDTDDVRVVTAWITGTILPSPDAPRAPQPSRMPTVEQGETAAQTFTTTDPDEPDTAVFEVRRVGGVASTSTVSLGATTGDLFVDQGSSDDKSAVVRFVPHPLFRGRYQFDIRVVDSFGLYSPATRVTGNVTTRGLYAELVEVQRTSGSAQLVSLGPVPMIDPELTDSVNGPDGVSCRIEGRVLRHLAELWDRRDPVTDEVDAGEVVAPFGVELHVWADGQRQFAGPVSRRSFDRFADLYSVDQRGIAAYLERRELEDEAAEFTNEEQTEIIASLIDAAQAAPYGELLIDTSTVTNTSENRTVTFDAGTALSDCIRELQDQLDGCEVRITADRELLADLWLGTDRRNELVFTEAIISGLRDDEDADALTTVAHVDGDEVTGSSSAGTGVLGRFGRVTSRADADRVGTEEGADRAAARLITTRGNAAKTVRFTHHAAVDAPQGRGAWDYRAGDVCTLDVTTPAGRFFAHGRIATRSIRPAAGPAGGYDIDLDVELLAPDGVVRPLRGAHNPDMVEQLYDLYKRR